MGFVKNNVETGPVQSNKLAWALNNQSFVNIYCEKNNYFIIRLDEK